jgi:hypothetical protein
MDHLFQHEADPIPDLPSVSAPASSGGLGRPTDEDEEEGAASLIGGSTADLEAKVTHPMDVYVSRPSPDGFSQRASDAPSAARSSEIPLSPISTLKRAVTRNSRNPRKRSTLIK